jgi:hypothetical protein
MPGECPAADILDGRDPMVGINDLLSNMKGQTRMHRALLGPAWSPPMNIPDMGIRILI